VGGATRSESVRAALAAAAAAQGAAVGAARGAGVGQASAAGVGQASGSAQGRGEAVIVHDAARPLATPELFEQTLAELERHECDAAIAAVPVSDTIKEVAADGRTVSSTLERSRLWAVQTPQVFRWSAIERALAAPPAVLGAATDDAWLIEQSGGVVRVVASDPGNIKVTSKTDLLIAEMLMADRLAVAPR
jgi:2-C-methyl-D-erythritol 4-phosphate cytidylyltransferase